MASRPSYKQRCINAAKRSKFDIDLSKPRLTPMQLYKFGNKVDAFHFDVLREKCGYTADQIDDILEYFLGMRGCFPFSDGGYTFPPLFEVFKIAETIAPDDFILRMKAGEFDPNNQL